MWTRTRTHSQLQAPRQGAEEVKYSLSTMSNKLGISHLIWFVFSYTNAKKNKEVSLRTAHAHGHIRTES